MDTEDPNRDEYIEELEDKLAVVDKALSGSEMTVLQLRVEVLTLRDVITTMTDCMLNYRPK
jgi:hypothetical protein